MENISIDFTPSISNLVQQNRQIRKINFTLQQQKANLINQLLFLKNTYIRQKKQNDSNLKKKNLAEKQLHNVKNQLKRTQTLNKKMSKRLYSLNNTKNLNKSFEKQNHKASTLATISGPSLTATATTSTLVIPKSINNISLQTNIYESKNISTQVDLENKAYKQSIKKYKGQIKKLCALLDKQNEFILNPQRVCITQRTNCGQRVTGRIVKSKKV